MMVGRWDSEKCTRQSVADLIQAERRGVISECCPGEPEGTSEQEAGREGGEFPPRSRLVGLDAERKAAGTLGLLERACTGLMSSRR